MLCKRLHNTIVAAGRETASRFCCFWCCSDGDIESATREKDEGFLEIEEYRAIYP